MIFTILLESSDKHKLEYSCRAENKNEAIERAFEYIEEQGEDVYSYEIKEIKEEK